MNVKKISSLIMYVLMAISLVALFVLFFRGEDGVGFALTWTYIILGLSVVITLAMAVVNMGKSPRGGKMGLIGVGILAVVLAVTYLMSSADPITLPDKTVYNSNFGLRWADMGLYTAYLALAVTIVAVIYGEIRKSLK